MSHRVNGIVAHIFVGIGDHDELTARVSLELEDGYQSFGGMAFPDRERQMTFVGELCTLFGVSDATLIQGRTCTVLRSFDNWNVRIEGLEVDGRRFTITGFWRRHVNPLIASPLAAALAQRSGEIASHKRRIEELEREISTLPEQFHDWEKQ